MLTHNEPEQSKRRRRRAATLPRCCPECSGEEGRACSRRSSGRRRGMLCCRRATACEELAARSGARRRGQSMGRRRGWREEAGASPPSRGGRLALPAECRPERPVRVFADGWLVPCLGVHLLTTWFVAAVATARTSLPGPYAAAPTLLHLHPSTWSVFVRVAAAGLPSLTGPGLVRPGHGRPPSGVCLPAQGEPGSAELLFASQC
jgi:hypothetical protein